MNPETAFNIAVRRNCEDDWQTTWYSVRQYLAWKYRMESQGFEPFIYISNS